MSRGVSNVWLPVADMDRAVAFYRDVLGLGVSTQTEEWTELDADGVTIGLNGRSSEHTGSPGDSGGAPVSMPSGLNEVVIEKQDLSRTVQVGIAIDGQHFTTYVADGVIIATPTGSTAYSLSARGPVVAPIHRALLFTAVSPHSLFDRSLVLEPTSTVEVSILGDRAAAVAVDGEQVQVLEPGSRVTVTSDERPARFVTFSDRNFHQILKTKFGLNTR